MKTDSQIQKDVMEELKWDPSVTHEQIGVVVEDGIVTLSGYVPTFLEKSAAEKATQRVVGVRAIAEEVEVKYFGSYRQDDADIASVALSALKWNVQVPDEKLKIKVTKGWIFLSGEVEWKFQKEAAENSVKSLCGVMGVTNSIEIKSKIKATDVKSKIEEALKRGVEREADRICISVDGSNVTLSGKVRSFSELLDTRGAAWSVPGVTSVQDSLMISS